MLPSGIFPDGAYIEFGCQTLLRIVADKKLVSGGYLVKRNSGKVTQSFCKLYRSRLPRKKIHAVINWSSLQRGGEISLSDLLHMINVKCVQEKGGTGFLLLTQALKQKH